MATEEYTSLGDAEGVCSGQIMAQQVLMKRFTLNALFPIIATPRSTVPRIRCAEVVRCYPRLMDEVGSAEWLSSIAASTVLLEVMLACK